jgi:hypothetical protein
MTLCFNIQRFAFRTAKIAISRQRLICIYEKSIIFVELIGSKQNGASQSGRVIDRGRQF